jgi:hypothetical protein
MLAFTSRGYRPMAGYSLHYRSACHRYRVTFGDLVGGIKIANFGLPPRWLAIVDTDAGQRIVSNHRSRAAAVAACEKHLKGAV